VDVGGTHYPGGQFIPAEVMENATAEEKDAVHNPKGKKKEPHEMTKKEHVEKWVEDMKAKRPEYAHLYDTEKVLNGQGRMSLAHYHNANKDHRSAVESALASGKTVPDHVLADYPDLAEKYPQKTNSVANVGNTTDENPKKAAQTPAIRTVERTRKLLASDQPLSKVIAAVQLQLEGHTHAELAEIKAHLGIKAGGAKAEMARKIAERVASVDKTNRRHYVHQAMSVDEVHDLIQSHNDAGTLDTADGVRSVVQAIGTGLTVRQVAELKQRLGIKAGGAKHEMATKIALRASQGKKPEAVANLSETPNSSPTPPEAKPAETVAPVDLDAPVDPLNDYPMFSDTPVFATKVAEAAKDVARANKVTGIPVDSNQDSGKVSGEGTQAATPKPEGGEMEANDWDRVKSAIDKMNWGWMSHEEVAHRRIANNMPLTEDQQAAIELAKGMKASFAGDPIAHLPSSELQNYRRTTPVAEYRSAYGPHTYLSVEGDKAIEHRHVDGKPLERRENQDPSVVAIVQKLIDSAPADKKTTPESVAAFERKWAERNAKRGIK
jgi:hypothetical protein